MNKASEYFFSTAKNPADISDVITSLAAGTPLELERLPNNLLPHAVLLASIGIGVYNQMIIDDYYGLLRRTEEVFARDDFSHRIMDHPQLMYVGMLARSRGGLMHKITEIPELSYAVKVYEELTTTDLEDLFPHEEQD